MINIVEHTSKNYSPRTKLNASLGDLTVAFYVDHTTAGERLTCSAAGRNYVSISICETSVTEAVKIIYGAMCIRNAFTLNIAGNGMYTLHKFGIDQQFVNEYILSIVRSVHCHRPISEIFSGGQTGADLAGIVAAKILGINATMTMPNGYIQRFEDKKDIVQTKEDIENQIAFWVDKL